jgi:hypothetical protein
MLTLSFTPFVMQFHGLYYSWFYDGWRKCGISPFLRFHSSFDGKRTLALIKGKCPEGGCFTENRSKINVYLSTD